MISGRSTIDKLGNQESESEGEEPPKEKTRPRKKKDKKSDKDFVRTEDIAAIVAEAINATLEKKTKWCSHCKYENCFDDQGKLKAEMQKYIAPKISLKTTTWESVRKNLKTTITKERRSGVGNVNPTNMHMQNATAEI